MHQERNKAKREMKNEKSEDRWQQANEISSLVTAGKVASSKRNKQIQENPSVITTQNQDDRCMSNLHTKSIIGKQLDWTTGSPR